MKKRFTTIVILVLLGRLFSAYATNAQSDSFLSTESISLSGMTDAELNQWIDELKAWAEEHIGQTRGGSDPIALAWLCQNSGILEPISISISFIGS